MAETDDSAARRDKQESPADDGKGDAPPVRVAGFDITRVAEIVFVFAASILFIFVTNRILSAIGFFEHWSGAILCSVTLALVIAYVGYRYGLARATRLVLIAAIFVGFCVFFVSVALTLWPGEQSQAAVYYAILVYAGVFSLLVIVLPQVFLWLRAWRARSRTSAERASPSQSWYELAVWVTGMTMVASFATTALGFYDEIVDPHDPLFLRLGLPIALSALASLVIWTGWNFVFRKMRNARGFLGRLWAFIVGLVVLVPLTLAISSVFGIIGVGGTEGLRAHHEWYANVLSTAYERVEERRQAELAVSVPVRALRDKFTQRAESERVGEGTTCPAGKGPLYQYYVERSKDAENILKQIDDRRNSDAALKNELIRLHAGIKESPVAFRQYQDTIRTEFTRLRTQILSLGYGSIASTINLFVDQLSVILDDAFFEGRNFGDCQLKQKPTIIAEVKREQAAILAANTSASDAGGQIQSPALDRLLKRRHVDAMPAMVSLINLIAGEDVSGTPSARTQPSPDASGIPPFVPLRPFWAVVSYIDRLPGYIALQLALDFSPAILGLLFALLAPLSFAEILPRKEKREDAAPDDPGENERPET